LDGRRRPHTHVARVAKLAGPPGGSRPVGAARLPGQSALSSLTEA
jgi:hypothetical protein